MLILIAPDISRWKQKNCITRWKESVSEYFFVLRAKGIERRQKNSENDPSRINRDSVAEAENVMQAKLFLQKYGNQILRFVYSYVHNMEDAEDILQETMIRLVQKAPKFENEVHEKAWLFQVAGNLSKNRIAYNAIRKTDELADELVAEKREDLSFVWRQ